MKARVAVVASVVILALVAGCGRSSQDKSAAPPDRTRSTIESTNIKVSDFTLPSIDGANVSLDDVLGKKLVLLDFSATWCHYCEEALPKLQKIDAAHSDKVKLLTIDEQEPLEDVKADAAKKGIKHTVLLDADGVVEKQYGVDGYPTFVLIGLNRNILYYGSDPDELSAAVDAALK
jgi:peroxiredoxin